MRAAARLKPFDFDTVMADVDKSHVLYPLKATDGLVFPYTPSISENLSVNFDSVSPTHSNEQYQVYTNTSNTEISLSNCVFTCDTLDNAQYALAALHFFRTYTKMDFGVDNTGSGIYAPASGRPPSPMWFSAMGKFGYSEVPVLMKSVSFNTMDPDVDLVPVPHPGSEPYLINDIETADLKDFRSQLRILAERAEDYDFTDQNVTYLPMKLVFGSVSLTVQHRPAYWKSFSLNDYRSGKLLLQDEG